jgi:hypothetical protein
MSKCQFFNQVASLDLPAKAKAELVMLWHRARTVAEGIIRFIERHKEFAEAVLIGAIMAFLVSKIPWIGGFLALCTLITSAAIGVLRELRESIASLFEPMTIINA